MASSAVSGSAGAPGAAAQGAPALTDPSVPPGTDTTTSTAPPDSTTTSSTTTTTAPDPSTLPPPTDVVPEQFGDQGARDAYEAIDGTGDARSGYYAAQVPFDPLVFNTLLPDEVAVAQTVLAGALPREAASRSALAAAQAELDAFERDLGVSEQGYQDAVRQAAEARSAFAAAAVSAYIGGGTPSLDAFLTAGDAGDYALRSGLLGAVVTARQTTAERFEALARSLDAEVLSRGRDLAAKRARVDDARAELVKATAARAVAQDAVEVWSAASHAMVPGFTFPVAGDHDPLWDSFGAPRNGGTSYAHWHEGTDIMAPLGTPIVAAEDGVVVSTRSNFLGGNALRVRGRSGYGYYYAHLVAIAPGVVDGLPVAAGQLLGWVGNTGDAAGGPTHLHFEIHRPDGSVVNPFPLLRVADARRPVVPTAERRAWGLALPDGGERPPLDPSPWAPPP